MTNDEILDELHGIWLTIWVNRFNPKGPDSWYAGSVHAAAMLADLERRLQDDKTT